MESRFLILMLCMTSALCAQEMQQVSTGTSYSLQSYANLEAGTERQVSNNAWDIAFTVTPDDAGIWINESVGSAAGLMPIGLYYTLSGDFSETPDPGVFTQFPLMNIERTWAYGAFNEIRSPQDPDDYGWGYFDSGNQEIVGINVFVVRLRDDSFLKIQIQSLSGGVYTFRYANLDGSNEITRTIAKADHPGKLMAYYSFATNDVVDIEPAGGFDLLFCRYTSLLEDPGGGDPVPYLVTGILSGPDVEVAQADGIDPATVMYEDYQGDLSPDLEMIGYDWKSFDLGALAWVLVDDRVYFVKTASGRVWKIFFTAFGGSSTGTATFEKTDLGILSSVHDALSPLSTLDVFPNPANHEAHVLFSVKSDTEHAAQLQIMDTSGQIISHYDVAVVPGLNAITLPLDGIPQGMYYVNVLTGGHNTMQKICVLN